jgi:hypothetical protein
MIDEAAWDRMESEATSGGQGVVRRRLATVNETYGMFAGVDLATGQRTVLIEIADAVEPQSVASAGVEVRVRTDPARPLIEVMLRNRAFAGVFTTFVNDLTSIAEAATGSDEVLDRVRVWIRFFEQVTPDGLSGFARRGLWGELFVLREVALPAWEPDRAAASWTGPNPGIHDFSIDGVALEVKASAAHQDQRLTISSERQLDDGPLKLLLLLQLAIDVRPGTSHTLPALVDELRELLLSHATASALFERQLLRAGYVDIHAPLYAEEQYSVRTARAFEVRDGFPRIIEPLPEGVGSVRYELSTSACGEFVLDWDDVVAVVRERAA